MPTIRPYEFKTDPKEYNCNWKARKGLLSSLVGLSKNGTTYLIEDGTFSISSLAEA